MQQDFPRGFSSFFVVGFLDFFLPTSQNHYTHESTILELFRGLQLQFSEVFRINSHYSYSSFLFYENAVAGKNSLREFSIIFRNCSYMIEMFSNFKCNDFEKNGKLFGPHQNLPFWAPPQKLCASFPEKEHKKSLPNMTGQPGYRQWKLMEEVLRSTSLVPLAFRCFVLCLLGVVTEELLDGGDHFHCTVEPLPGHIWCRKR